MMSAFSVLLSPFPKARFTSQPPLNPLSPLRKQPSIRPHPHQAQMHASPTPESHRSILVFGGGSTLGKQVVTHFVSAHWRVYTLDFYDASVECGGVNGCTLPRETHVPISLALPASAPARTQVDIASKCLASACADKFDVVLNATLGFAAAGIGDDDIFETIDYMYRTSVESTLVTAKLAETFMSEGGLLTFIGSVAALPATVAPRMLAFGAAKASVHQIVRLLAGSVGTDLPQGSAVVAIVPEVLDTPLHRSMNGGAVGQNWTPCDVVASKLLEWAQDPQLRPPNASLISVATQRSPSEERDAFGKAATSEDLSEHMFRLIQDSSFVQSAQL